MKNNLNIIAAIAITTLIAIQTITAQHVVPTPDCNEPSFGVMTRRWNMEPREWTAYTSRVVCQLPDFDMSAPFVEKNVYGSRTDRRTTATGFFRTEKIDGRWWIVDPAGFLQVNVGVCAVNKGSSPRNVAAYASKYGNNRTNWMRDMKTKLKNYGFYALTAWTEDTNVAIDKSSNPMAYTPIFNFKTTYNGRRKSSNYSQYGYGNPSYTTPDNGVELHVFDPEFPAFCDHFAKTNCEPLKTDRDVLGYFSDNELPFTEQTLTKYLGVSDKTYPGYVEAKNFVESNGYTVSDVLAGKQTSGSAMGLSELKEEWLYHLCSRYYSCVRAAIKKYAPNQMYIGSRLHIPGSEHEGIVRAAAENTDIVSFNTYRVWFNSREQAETWSAYAGDFPFLVTEFYAKGEDVFDSQGNKFENKSGAGYIVYTQKERGFFYQTFCLGMLEAKNCVGWHHFKFMDNDPEGESSDNSNVDSNKGLVSNDYDFYTDMVNTAKELNDRIYNLVDYFDGRYVNPEPVGIMTDIAPEADANYKDSSNEGTSENLAIKEASPYRQALIRFDISSIPDNVAWVGLNLTSTRTIGDPQTNFYAIDIASNNSWSETGLVKSNMPESSYKSINYWTTNTGITANVTHYIKFAKRLGWTKITFKIRVSNQGTPDYMTFGSRENTDPEKRPKLQYAMQVSSAVKDKQINNKASVYPNPTKGDFTVELNDLTPSPFSINIYNAQGQLYKTAYNETAKNERTSVPLSINDSGLYFVRIIQDNAEIQTVKLIVN